MKKFFSLDHFYELKTLAILESIILVLLILILNTPSNDTFLSTHSLFKIWAAIISIVIYILCCLIDPQNYFNFFTLLFTTPFTYGCFWFIFTFMVAI